MANTFQVEQRLSQDAQGCILTLIDFSNYNDITPNQDDRYINSLGNIDSISVNDFITRKWILEDINGNLTEVDFNYTEPQLNRCSTGANDQYYKITLSITTIAGITYNSTIETGLHRQAEYKLFVITNVGGYGCNEDKTYQIKTDARNLVESAKFKLNYYDNEGFNTDINAANKLLDSILCL